MRQMSQGFILFIVLIFTQFFALLGMAALANAGLSIKAQSHQLTGENLYRFSIQLLHRLENKVLKANNIKCLKKVMPADSLAKKPLLWWQENACSDTLSKIRYYYRVEFLGSDFCCSIKNPGQKNLIGVVDFYRLSLLAPQGNAKIRLQGTDAVLSNKLPVCTGAPHSLTLGHQMHREI